MNIDHPAHQTFLKLTEELQKMGIGGVELFEQLAMTKNFIKILTERTDELTELAMGEMEMNQETKKETSFGKFTIAERSKWKYSENIKPLEEAVKIAKKQEEEDGIAEKEITKYLLVK